MKKRFLFLSVLSLCFISPAIALEYDLVIKNGRVMDPETKYDAIANVGIKDGKIVKITTDKLSGKQTIDAAGHVVAPGFIDIHAHGQNIGDYRMQAMQGVTTMLELESGVLPISQWCDDQGKKHLPLYYGTAVGWSYARIATFSGTQPEATVAYFQEAQSSDDWKMQTCRSGQWWWPDSHRQCTESRWPITTQTLFL